MPCIKGRKQYLCQQYFLKYNLMMKITYFNQFVFYNYQQIKFDLYLQNTVFRRMSKCSLITSFIKSNDLFSSLQLLRFNKSNKISTMEGGLVSIIIFAILSFSFISVISQTFSKTNITYVQTISNQKDGVYSQMKMGEKGNFMFAVRLSNKVQNTLNLSDTRRYIDFNLYKMNFAPDSIQSIIPIKLEQCTKDHWTAFPEIAVDFDTLQMQKWLCPPKNQTFGLSGLFLSQHAQGAVIQALPCNNQSNYGNSICYSQQQINQYFQANGILFINLLFTNPILNLQNVDYISYQLNKYGTYPISQEIGSISDISLSDFTIKTDTSIWPFSNYQYVSGLMIDGDILCRTAKYSQNTGYLIVHLSKSSASVAYLRQVQKISIIVSYIGGLFGIIYGCLFFMNVFTEQFYLITMVKQVFCLQKDTQIGKFCQKFNFIKFCQMKITKFLAWISVKDVTSWMKQLQQYKQQLNIQLDVSLLVKRISKLQQLMINTFPHDQIVECANKKVSLRKIREEMGGVEYAQKKEEHNQIELKQQSLFTEDQINKKNFINEMYNSCQPSMKPSSKLVRKSKMKDTKLIINHRNEGQLYIIKNQKQLKSDIDMHEESNSNMRDKIEKQAQIPCIFNGK